MNLDDLRRRRGERFFEAWDGFIPVEHVQASEAILLELVDGLLSLETNEDESGARLLVKRAVIRFNELNDGWLCTIEREDTCDRLSEVVELYGLTCDEDWFQDREW